MTAYRMKNGRFKSIEYHIKGNLIGRGGKEHNPNAANEKQRKLAEKAAKKKYSRELFVGN